MKKAILVFMMAVLVAVFTGCVDDATVARSNLETAEQNFQITRHFVQKEKE